jgi:hypothetical protein
MTYARNVGRRRNPPMSITYFGHKMKIFGSAVVEPKNTSRASIKQVLALVLRIRLF